MWKILDFALFSLLNKCIESLLASTLQVWELLSKDILDCCFFIRVVFLALCDPEDSYGVPCEFTKFSCLFCLFWGIFQFLAFFWWLCSSSLSSLVLSSAALTLLGRLSCVLFYLPSFSFVIFLWSFLMSALITSCVLTFVPLFLWVPGASWAFPL